MKKLEELFGDMKISFGEQLRLHTSMRVGGPAGAIYEPLSVSELVATLQRARRHRVPVLFMGGGSNLIFSDSGVAGLVIKLSRLDEVTPAGGNGFFVGAGLHTSRFLSYCVNNNLGGAEFLAGIPGTIGGAFCMNAGSFDGETKDIITGARVCRQDGKIEELAMSDISFRYRGCSFGNGAVLGVYVSLENSDRVKSLIDRNLERRREVQPVGGYTAGSIFKNPPGMYAGQIIDSLGLKGMRIGDAEVSTRHANFIVNRGSATSRDIKTLIRKVGKKVYTDTGISLGLEVVLVGRT